MDEFYKKTISSGWISYCFPWAKTPGGDNLWSDIHSKWLRHLKSNRMNESFNPEEDWEEENFIEFDFNHTIRKRNEIPLNEGDEVIFQIYEIDETSNELRFDEKRGIIISITYYPIWSSVTFSFEGKKYFVTVKEHQTNIEYNFNGRNKVLIKKFNI